MNDATETTRVTHLLALAFALEREGRYNNAKLLRAAADALATRAAYASMLATDLPTLISASEQALAALSAADLDGGFMASVRHSVQALTDNRLAMFDETPDPFVCRTCGHLQPTEPIDNCPICSARPALFRQFRPVYWLDAADPTTALRWLRQTPQQVAALIDGVSDAACMRTPLDGGWSIHQVVSHLRDAQAVMHFRLTLILAEENPPLEAKAVWQWAADEQAGAPTTAHVFAEYSRSRAESVELLEEISLKDWQRPGRHLEFGAVTLQQQASYFAAHEITHLPQLEALCRQR